MGGGDNFAGFGREQLGDERRRCRVAADRPTRERRYVSVSRLLSDRAPIFIASANRRSRPAATRGAGSRPQRLADRERKSRRTEQDFLSEYRNDGCRRLAAIGTRSIKTPRSTGGHMSETKREYAASYRKSLMHTRFKKG
jgi:hypothetical protein